MSDLYIEMNGVRPKISEAAANAAVDNGLAPLGEHQWAVAAIERAVLAEARDEVERLRAGISTLRAYIRAEEGRGPIRLSEALELCDSLLDRSPASTASEGPKPHRSPPETYNAGEAQEQKRGAS